MNNNLNLIDNQQKFDIQLVNANYSSNKKKEIDKASYDKVEKTVRRKMTEVKGTPDEIEKHNQVLCRCVVGDPNAQIQVKFMIKQIIEQELGTDFNIDFVIEQIYRDNYGLSAIDDLVADNSINEIWVNGYNHIWIEKGGMKKRLDRRFKSDDAVIRVMNQMLQFDKKAITTQEPTVESKLLDGSRITFIIPPVGSRPYINIRKFKAFEINEENILQTKTITTEMLDFLKIVIKGRANMLCIGETGSGKTSFLKFLCDYMSPRLRVGTIESNFELKLSEKYPERNIYEYEEHPEIGRTLGALFRLCLRSSPDVILIGEMRGSEEAEQFINACRRGHPGTIATIHTNSPETSIDDLMEMILEDGKKREPAMLKHRIASAIEIIIQSHRYEETGERKVIKISEVVPNFNTDNYGSFEINDIFTYEDRNKEFKRVGHIQNATLIKKLQFFGVTDEELKEL